ncbi:alpha/beta fold hydrolase [Streptomyces hirsutus]
MSATVSFEVTFPHGPQTLTLSDARAGRGEPLLLLHGIGHHRQAWDPVVDILATEREVIAVDLPWFGASPALPGGLAHDLPTMTAALAALCGKLELDRPHVAGNWLGGLLALEFGREKLVRSVSALSPAGFWTQAERRYAFGVLVGMRRIAERMPLPLVERLARSAAGRAALTSTIYARPGRRSPEAVVAETLALAGCPASPRRSGRAPPCGSPTTCPASRSPSPGAPATGCSSPVRGSAPSERSPGHD